MTLKHPLYITWCVRLSDESDSAARSVISRPYLQFLASFRTWSCSAAAPNSFVRFSYNLSLVPTISCIEICNALAKLHYEHTVATNFPSRSFVGLKRCILLLFWQTQKLSLFTVCSSHLNSMFARSQIWRTASRHSRSHLAEDVRSVSHSSISSITWHLYTGFGSFACFISSIVL